MKTNFFVEIIFQHIQIFECVSKFFLNRMQSKSGNKKNLHQKYIIFIYWYRLIFFSSTDYNLELIKKKLIKYYKIILYGYQVICNR
jgi:hypothetical protein